MDVSGDNGTPKSSILIGFSIINHPFWSTTILGTTHVALVNLFFFAPGAMVAFGAERQDLSAGSLQAIGANQHRR